MRFWKVALIIGIFIISTFILYIYLIGFSATADSSQRECNFNQECELSLCDCKCYLVNETPEAKRGVFCGINCAKEAGVSDCVCSEGICVTI